MALQGSWVSRGYFDLSGEPPHSNTTQTIRRELCARLGRPAKDLHMASYPVGPAWRHAFWWRDSDTDYAEAQFFLQIMKDHAILSLGVSVEKGYENVPSNDPQRLDRTFWDWQRLVDSSPEVLSEVPAIATAIGSPVTFSLRSSQHGVVFEKDSRAFSFADGAWFERGKGHSGVEHIAERIATLDQQHDRWVYATFNVEFDTVAADQMLAGKVADLLYAFNPIRQHLRGSL